jgi:membrane-bound serine protease (ClpP class)
MNRPERKSPLRLLLIAGLLAVGASAALPESPPPEAEPAKPLRTAIVPLSGFINEALVTSVQLRAEEAVADGYEFLIIHITSNGGEVGAGMILSRNLQRLGRDIRTLAYVDAKAYSAAALAALSCQEIVMMPEASIGDCAPIMMGPQGVVPMEGPEREKTESALRERMESIAESHGYPPALTRAMVTQRIVVIEAVNAETGEARYIEEGELEGLGEGWEKTRIIDDDQELLTLGARKAKEYGIASHLVEELDDLYDLYPIDGRITPYAVKLSEQLVLVLNSMWLKSILVLLGLMGLYIELNTPGFGVPGAVGLVAFGLLFAASFLAGRPYMLPPLMFVAGLAMLAIELFVTPGFGVLGGAGALLVIGSIIVALPKFEGLPERDFEWAELGQSVAMTAGVLAAFTVFAFVLARFLPQLPLLRRLVLAPGIVSDGSSRAAGAIQERGVATGDRGRTLSKLRPAGKARIADRLVDVVTEGDFIDAGRDVEVVAVRGNRIVVVPAQSAADEAAT